MNSSEQREALRQQLMHHEGVRLHPYTDTVGKLTVGVGRNLTDRGISEAEARILLDNDITMCIGQLTAFPWFPDLDPIRQRVFVDLCFNLGIAGLRTFRRMLVAAARGDWETAATELAASKYAEQVGQRAITLARMLESGEA